MLSNVFNKSSKVIWNVFTKMLFLSHNRKKRGLVSLVSSTYLSTVPTFYFIYVPFK